NQRRLVAGMRELEFRPLLPERWHSPIITSFVSPAAPAYEFGRFYQSLKRRGFVIYPGKVTNADTFRIGTIGHVYPSDVDRLLAAVQASMDW
ncbi:MAG: 2-aminoethylphosphonate--pyruvate transaminase, partial [Desulfovibrionaceae bacterium]